MTNDAATLTPVFLALLATLFTWSVTALGAATVFLTRNISRRLLDWLLGFAGGVMLAASFWSLLAPAIELADQQGVPAWLPAVVGFLMGGVFLRLIDKVLPHLHIGMPTEAAEGIKTTWQRAVLLVTAITLHNIPEGLAVGVAFGAVSLGLPSATLPAAIALAVGSGRGSHSRIAERRLRRPGYNRHDARFRDHDVPRCRARLTDCERGLERCAC